MYATVFVFFFSDYYFLLSSTELPSTILWYDFSRLWCHLLSPPLLHLPILLSRLVLSSLSFSLFLFLQLFLSLWFLLSFLSYLLSFSLVFFSARQWQKLYQVVGNWGTFFKKQWKRAWWLQRKEINHPGFRFLFHSFLFLLFASFLVLFYKNIMSSIFISFYLFCTFFSENWRQTLISWTSYFFIQFSEIFRDKFGAKNFKKV